MMNQITPDLNVKWLADGGCLLMAGDTQIVLTDAEVARLRRWLANNEWHPIASAPKDGTSVLGYGSEGVEIMRYEGGSGPSIDDPGQDAGWVGLYAFPGSTQVRRESPYYREAQGQPTHWMPIPSPPEQPSAAAAYAMAWMESQNVKGAPV